MEMQQINFLSWMNIDNCLLPVVVRQLTDPDIAEQVPEHNVKSPINVGDDSMIQMMLLLRLQEKFTVHIRSYVILEML